MLKFKAKIWKQGDSWVITIPKDFIKTDMIEQNQEYQFYIMTELNEAQDGKD